MVEKGYDGIYLNNMGDTTFEKQLRQKEIIVLTQIELLITQEINSTI